MPMLRWTTGPCRRSTELRTATRQELSGPTALTRSCSGRHDTREAVINLRRAKLMGGNRVVGIHSADPAR